MNTLVDMPTERGLYRLTYVSRSAIDSLLEVWTPDSLVSSQENIYQRVLSALLG